MGKRTLGFAKKPAFGIEPFFLLILLSKLA